MFIGLRIFGLMVVIAILLNVFFNLKESHAKVEPIVLDPILVVPQGVDKNFKSSITPIKEVKKETPKPKKEVVKPQPKKVDKERKIPTLKDKYKKEDK